MANSKDKKKEPFVITEEMINKATSYIPFNSKVAFAKVTSEACLEAVDKTTDDIAQATRLPIPQLYREQCGTKQIYLMYYFLTEYLHIAVSEDFTDEDYDYYAGSHIFNQLERFKSGNPDIKNKVFDILYDFKELKKMLETEIFNFKESINDTLNRIQDSISLYASPENIKALTDLMQKTIGDIETKQAEVNQKRPSAKKTEPTENK